MKVGPVSRSIEPLNREKNAQSEEGPRFYNRGVQNVGLSPFVPICGGIAVAAEAGRVENKLA